MTDSHRGNSSSSGSGEINYSSSSLQSQRTGRTRLVAAAAIDAGGLVTELLDDYMEELKTYEVNI